MEEINLITEQNSKSPIAEAYRTIRTNLQFSGSDLKKIIVTSATPNEGKSTTITNLAVVLAQAGFKVIAVDCDMRNPTLHKLFKVSNKGVSNIIALGDSVFNHIQPSGIANCDVIASGPIPPNPSELLVSAKMDEMLATLEAHYDYILLDTPPIMPVTDSAILSSKVDGVIMVISSGTISPSVAVEAKNRLLQAGANILGVIINKVEVEHNHAYGYYYYYGSDGEKHKH